METPKVRNERIECEKNNKPPRTLNPNATKQS